MKKQSANELVEKSELRSNYIWSLICKSEKTDFYDTPVKIPRILVQFWDNARTIPPDVHDCIDSWRHLEKHGFERYLYDDQSAREYIMNNCVHRYLEAFDRCRHPAMRSDYFRLCFIYSNGGFYVDADDVYKGVDIEPLFRDSKLKIQPLCYDTSTEQMINVADFMGNSNYYPNYIYYVNNAPIISPPKHPLIHIAIERATQSLLDPKINIKDIQSITGPGNLTASLVQHDIECQAENKCSDYELIDNWDYISIPKWPLEYRKDKRNWRIWDGSDM